MNQIKISLQPKQKLALEKSYKTPVLFYGGAKGGGKAQSLHSFLLTPNGFITMGDVKIGQELITPSGKVARVKQIHPQGVKPLYEVSFIDGSKTLATLDHLWKYKIVGRSDGWIVSSTSELINRLDKVKKSTSTVTPNILIPMCSEIEYEEKSLPIKPYTLGVLIAEGCFRGKSTVFTSDDNDIVENVRRDGYPVNSRSRKLSHCINDRLKLKKEIEKFGLWNKKSEDKFIPSVYLMGSIEQRLELLRGLMDGDGYMDDRGHCEYTTVSKQLSEDVRFIIKSLGGKATISKQRSSYIGKDGIRVMCLDKYRTYIRLRDNSKIFKLERKKKRNLPFNGGLGSSYLRLKSIKYWGLEEAQCITLDDEDGLYLTDDFIVTHNSYLVRAREMIRRLKYPNTKGLIIRRSYPELLSNHIRMFFKEYPQTRTWFNKSEKAIYWPNGSITEFSYLQNVDDVFTYQGREFEDISIDEVTQHEEDTFKILRSSNRTSNLEFKNNGGIPTMLLTGNPGGRGHQWVKRIFVDRNFNPNEDSEDFDFVQAKVQDNMALTDADPNYIKRLKDLPPDMVKAYLEGDWNIFSGQFFSEFRNHLHVCQPFIPSKSFTFVAGMDWGRTAPFAFELSAIEVVKHEGTSFNRVWTFMEVTGVEKTPTEWAGAIKREMRRFGLDVKELSWVRGDPAMFTRGNDMSMSIANQFARAGNNILIQPASNDRIGGWTAMHQWLSIAPDGKPYWMIAENCKELITTLPSLVYDDEKIEDLDTHQNDHYCFVAGTKVLTKAGKVNIEDIRVDDLVETPLGYFPVIDCGCTGIYNTNRYKFSNGNELICTPNHPIATKKGFLPIHQIKLNSKAEHIIGMENITYQEGGALTTNGYTPQFGRRLMGLFQSVLRYTIGILILEIMPYLIYFWLKNQNIGLFMQNSNGKMVNIEKEGQNIWRILENLQKNGTPVRRVEYGTRSIGKSQSARSNRKSLTVRYVKQFLLPQIIRQDFAPITANQNIGEYPVLTIFKKLVQLATKLSLLTNILSRSIALVGVSKDQKRKVYNLKVGPGMYFANGILVSNCDASRYALKHIRWIDAGSGSILHREDTQKILTAVMKNGKQIGIDLSKFGNVKLPKVDAYSLNRFDRQ